VLDEFLSLAVREVDDRVIFGLALSLPACILLRGVGQEALDYCLANRTLSDARRAHVQNRLSNLRGVGETACDHLRRLRGYAGFSGATYFYYKVLSEDADEVFANCSEEITEYLTDPCFGPKGNRNLDCVVIAIEHSRDPLPFIKHWIDWLDAGLFDSENRTSGSIYYYLDLHPDDPKFRQIAQAAHAHIVELLSSPDRVVQTWWHLRGLLERKYAGANKVVAAVRRSGLQLDDTQQQILHYQLGTLVALAEGSAGGKSFDEWESLMLGEQPPSGA
jgi:hypothetical protein